VTRSSTSSPYGVTHHSRTVNGVRLHYVTAGKGDPVLLLHGWPQTWFAWRHVIPLLAANCSVIAPDMRGMGDSEKPYGGYDKVTVARDLHELVRTLGHDRIFLAGHDMGGQVAYPYAAMWPEEVRALVFIESSLPAFGQEELMDVAKGGSWHFGFNMAGDISEALVRGRERLLIEHWMRRSAVSAVDPTNITDEALNRYAHALAQPGGLRSSFAYYRAIPQDREDNKRLGAARLKLPVLAIDGERGFPGGPQHAMRLVANDVHSFTVMESGHYPAEERPETLAAAMLSFFQSSSTLG
jgi:pimeloyl-ACP methyl ester carboxylesterase